MILPEPRVRVALLSAWDKAGLADFARGLSQLGIKLLASGGTARHLREAGLEVRDLSSWTGFDSFMDGRVKTLHPAVAGAILARPGHEGDAAELAKLGAEPIDLVAVDLYPFEEARKAGKTEAELVELIDIGGVTLLRAAAKNFARVTCVSERSQYAGVLEALRAGGASLDEDQRRGLAAEAFDRTCAYDAAISVWLAGIERKARIGLGATPLRYGENPHQPARLLGSGTTLDLRAGDTPSFNNLLDLAAAWRIAREVQGTVVVKHAGPCGAARAPNTPGGYPAAIEAAFACDPEAAYGGVIGLGAELDIEAAAALVKAPFLEAIIAPSVRHEALRAITARSGWGKRVRIVTLPYTNEAWKALDVRATPWGMLTQDRDIAPEDPASWRSEGAHAPDERERGDLETAWKLVRHVRSNAIAILKDGASVGIGGGFPSRVDAARWAVHKAGERARGAVAASDGFFPFADGLEVLADAGVTAVVQPGGSKRDGEVAAAARARGLAMLLTGRRCFLH